MPKCCANCDLFYDYMCCPVTGTHADFEKMNSERLPNCPLREMFNDDPPMEYFENGGI